jgi:chorismate mutase
MRGVSTWPNRKRMNIPWHNLGISLVILIGGISTASAQRPADKLELLVETVARRLEVARQVAFAKWDMRSQVEDAAREAEVITAAVKAGQSTGLGREFVSNFFRAQIEAKMQDLLEEEKTLVRKKNVRTGTQFAFLGARPRIHLQFQ